MNLAGRMILLIIIVDTFLFFGMGAINLTPDGDQNYGGYMGQIVGMDGNSTNNSWGQSMVNTNTTGDVVPEATQTWANFNAIFNSIFGFIQLMFSIATAPFNFLTHVAAPTFVKVLVGGAYIVMCIIAVVQLISGRAA